MITKSSYDIENVDMWWRRLPYSIDHDYTLTRAFDFDNICPFVEKTGEIDYKKFDVANSLVTLEHEKDNPADRKALKVLIDGTWVGYLYRDNHVRRTFFSLLNRNNEYRIIGRLCYIDYKRGKASVIFGLYKKVDLTDYESIGEPEFIAFQESLNISEYLNYFVEARWFDEGEYKWQLAILSNNREIGCFSRKSSLMIERIGRIRNCLFYVKDASVNRRGKLKIVVEVFVKKEKEIEMEKYRL